MRLKYLVELLKNLQQTNTQYRLVDYYNIFEFRSEFGYTNYVER